MKTHYLGDLGGDLTSERVSETSQTLIQSDQLTSSWNNGDL